MVRFAEQGSEQTVRLILSALVIVGAFGLGAWGIAFLLPSSPAWLNVAVSVVWLFALIASAFLVGNQRGSTQEERSEFRHVLCDNILYLGLAIVPITFLIALEIYDLDKGIQRNVKQNWLLCSVTAGTVLGLSIEKYWHVRRCWQMWAVLAVYAALHFSIGIPALAHLEKVRYGYISLLAMPELLLVSFILYSVEAKHARSLR
jgi:hypothetical protein